MFLAIARLHHPTVYVLHHRLRSLLGDSRNEGILYRSNRIRISRLQHATQQREVLLGHHILQSGISSRLHRRRTALDLIQDRIQVCVSLAIGQQLQSSNLSSLTCCGDHLRYGLVYITRKSEQSILSQQDHLLIIALQKIR